MEIILYEQFHFQDSLYWLLLFFRQERMSNLLFLLRIQVAMPGAWKLKTTGTSSVFFFFFFLRKISWLHLYSKLDWEKNSLLIAFLQSAFNYPRVGDQNCRLSMTFILLVISSLQHFLPFSPCCEILLRWIMSENFLITDFHLHLKL